MPRGPTKEHQERIREVIEELERTQDVATVAKDMVAKYDISSRTSIRWVNEALARMGRGQAAHMHMQRARLDLEFRRVLAELQSAAEMAADEGNVQVLVQALRGQSDHIAKWAKVLHVDRISPFLGLEAAELRGHVIGALKAAPHLLTSEERDELQAALRAMGDEEAIEIKPLPEAWIEG